MGDITTARMRAPPIDTTSAWWVHASLHAQLLAQRNLPFEPISSQVSRDDRSAARITPSAITSTQHL